jgi:hypothetical protein
VTGCDEEEGDEEEGDEELELLEVAFLSASVDEGVASALGPGSLVMCTASRGIDAKGALSGAGG